MKVRQTTKNGKPAWLVDFGLVSGKRKRGFYGTKAAADKAVSIFRADTFGAGDEWLEIPAREKLSIVSILRQIRESGTTLEAVWKQHQGSTKPAPPGTMTLGAACVRFMDSKRRSGLRPAYIDNLGIVVERFVKGREESAIPTSPTEIEHWIHSQPGGAQWRETIRSRLITFYSWLVQTGAAPSNPCLAVARIRWDAQVPEILTVESASKLLQLTKTKHPKLLPAVALGLFAGIRPHELRRLSWDAVSLDSGTVTVSTAASKLRQRRIVPLSENAVAWLRLGGELPAQPHRRSWDSLWTAMKIDRIKDVLRHTAASFLLAREESSDRVALWLGNSPKILFRHYRDLVTKENCEKFWRISPCVSKT